MAYPMILPWLARKSRVPIPVAEKLWDQSLAEGNRRFAQGLRGSNYWRHVLTAFRAALAAKAPLATAEAGPASGWELGLGLYLLHIQFLNRAWWAWTGVVRRAFTCAPKVSFLPGLRA